MADNIHAEKNERTLLAVSIKHTGGKWKFGEPLVLWGRRTSDNEERSFSGYTMFPDDAELYTAEEFRKEYTAKWIKTDAAVKLNPRFCKEWREYDTVLVEYEDCINYYKASDTRTRRLENAT